MRGILIAATSSAVLVLGVPSLASAAHKSRCHHHSHHACAKSKHASRARLLTFGGPVAATSPSTGASSPTAPAGPAEPTETAGTVASFTGGVLTITLKDGSTVSGKITEASEIRCQSATPAQEGDDDQGGDEASSGSGEDGSPSPHGESRIGSHGDDLSAGHSGEDGEGESSACTAAALVPGAVVAEAELSIGSGGAIWDHVDLISF